MAKRLLDTVEEIEVTEELETTNKEETKKKPVEQIISKEGAKDKQISAKVNMKIYNAFTQINRMQGISNNSALNMLITKYVRENKSILDDDNIF